MCGPRAVVLRPLQYVHLGVHPVNRPIAVELYSSGARVLELLLYVATMLKTDNYIELLVPYTIQYH